MIDVDDIETLQEAKVYVQQGKHLTGGVECPCCGRRVKQYDRHVNSGLAFQLLVLYRDFPHRQFVHVEAWRKAVMDSKGKMQGGEHHTMKHWGLIEERLNDEGLRGTGEWRITPFGIDFMDGKATISYTAKIYNNTFQGFAGKQVDVLECLGDDFDYFELMEASAPV